jgi:hypothetical protein
MKVKELITKLQEKNPESEVYTEGCDCIGESTDVVYAKDFFLRPSKEFGHKDDDVIIRRED